MNGIDAICVGGGGDHNGFIPTTYPLAIGGQGLRGGRSTLPELKTMGCTKEVTFMINGQGAYSRLKYESGVHRVQRVPETESSGRIHTSTITVAIMPEAEEIDFQLDMNDCKFDVFRASGNGGQCVNTTAYPSFPPSFNGFPSPCSASLSGFAVSINSLRLVISIS